VDNCLTCGTGLQPVGGALPIRTPRKTEHPVAKPNTPKQHKSHHLCNFEMVQQVPPYKTFMIQTRTILLLALAASLRAQTPEVSIQTPPPPRYVGPILRPFHVNHRTVAPVKLTNTPRLESLVRGGNLYLSSQDVIALALENNIDIAIQRYGPYLAQEVLRRAQGGAPLRSVGVSIFAGPQSVSLAGVDVSGVGLADSGTGVTSGNGLVASIGTSVPSLDPQLSLYASYGHNAVPLTVQALNFVPTLVSTSRQYYVSYSQQFVTGSSMSLTYSSTRQSTNSPANTVNPFTSADLDFYVTQNLLEGWGVHVNNRYIRIAKNNVKVTDLQLKRQVITTVSAILNLYWDLVSFNEDRRIKETALATAQKLYEDNQYQVGLGTLPAIEVTRAAEQVSASKEDLLIAETNVAQQEIVLKNALSRTGIESAWLDEVHIIPLDSIVVPEKEDLKPQAELIQQALENRPEIDQAKVNLESKKIALAGTKNSILPTLQAFADLNNQGLTGVPNPLNTDPRNLPPPDVVGGYGNLLGQIFRRDFPNYSAGISMNIPFRNRAPQADYVTDLLDVRQSELQLQKAESQIRVDVKRATIGLQQARSRYETAVATRVLAQQSLDAEQNLFKFGQSSIPAVVQAQRDLALDQSGEVQAMANYTHARIAFDDAIGQTLDVNRISIEEAKAGQVARQSLIPASIPQNPR
jgi:outer membrane protein